jgi:hypothetical protein
VVEEKLDGSNSAISFDDDGGLRLQSRGHILMVGRGSASSICSSDGQTITGLPYGHTGVPVCEYGEWLYAPTPIPYDICRTTLWNSTFSIARRVILSTDRRQRLLAGTPARCGERSTARDSLGA